MCGNGHVYLFMHEFIDALICAFMNVCIDAYVFIDACIYLRMHLCIYLQMCKMHIFCMHTWILLGLLGGFLAAIVKTN